MWFERLNNLFKHLDEINDFLTKYVTKINSIKNRQPKDLTKLRKL